MFIITSILFFIVVFISFVLLYIYFIILIIDKVILKIYGIVNNGNITRANIIAAPPDESFLNAK